MSAAATSAKAPPLAAHLPEMAIGLVAGIAGLIPALFLTESQGRLLLAITLVGIGWVYFGFAVADGRPSAIAVQAVSAAAFLWIAYAGVQLESTTLLGAGYVAHAVWDALHHEGRGPTHVRTWYPPFCVVADLVIATPLLAGWI